MQPTTTKAEQFHESTPRKASQHISLCSKACYGAIRLHSHCDGSISLHQTSNFPLTLGEGLLAKQADAHDAVI